MNTFTDLLTGLAIITFICIIGLGFANKLVIFYDRNDYGRTLLLAISGFIFYALIYVAENPSTATKYFYTPIVGLICIVLLLDSIIFSTRHNGGNVMVGFLVAITRTFYIVFTILLVAFLMQPSRDKNGRIQLVRTLLGFAAAGGVTYLSFMLINGDKVINSQIHQQSKGE